MIAPQTSGAYDDDWLGEGHHYPTANPLTGGGAWDGGNTFSRLSDLSGDDDDDDDKHDDYTPRSESEEKKDDGAAGGGNRQSKARDRITAHGDFDTIKDLKTKRRKIRKYRMTSDEVGSRYYKVLTKTRNSAFWMAVVCVLKSFAHHICYYVWIIDAKETMGASHADVDIIFYVGLAVSAFMEPITGWAADLAGFDQMMSITALFLALCVALQCFSTEYFLLSSGYLLMSLFEPDFTLGLGYMAKMLPFHYSCLYTTWLQSGMLICRLCAPLLAKLLVATISYRMCFIVSAALASISFALSLTCICFRQRWLFEEQLHLAAIPIVLDLDDDEPLSEDFRETQPLQSNFDSPPDAFPTKHKRMRSNMTKGKTNPFAHSDTKKGDKMHKRVRSSDAILIKDESFEGDSENSDESSTVRPMLKESTKDDTGDEESSIPIPEKPKGSEASLVRRLSESEHRRSPKYKKMPPKRYKTTASIPLKRLDADRNPVEAKPFALTHDLQFPICLVSKFERIAGSGYGVFIPVASQGGGTIGREGSDSSDLARFGPPRGRGSKFQQCFQFPQLGKWDRFILINAYVTSACIAAGYGIVAYYYTSYLRDRFGTRSIIASAQFAFFGFWCIVGAFAAHALERRYNSALTTGRHLWTFMCLIIHLITFGFLYPVAPDWAFWILAMPAGITMGAACLFQTYIFLTISPALHSGKVIGVRGLTNMLLGTGLGTLIADWLWHYHIDYAFYTIVGFDTVAAISCLLVVLSSCCKCCVGY